MIILLFVGLWLSVCIVVAIVQYVREPKPPHGLTAKEYYSYYYNKEWQLEEEDEQDIQLEERLMLLDETIVKYNKLLDNLTDQYNNTYNEKERSRILSKQIITLEKLNKALEKREKLDAQSSFFRSSAKCKLKSAN